MKKLALGVACAALPSLAIAGLFGPSTYDECVLEHLKGVSGDVGARMVAAACAKQFPAKKPAEKSVAPAAPTGQPATEPKAGEFTNFVPGPAK